MESDYEDMEFEYTNPQPFMSSCHYDNNYKPTEPFTLPPSGTFSIPSSFFEAKYKNSSLITNAVCSLLDKFTFDEKDSNEPEEDNQIKESEKSQSSTPTHEVEESTNNDAALLVINNSEPTQEQKTKSCTYTSPIGIPQQSEDSKEEAYPGTDNLPSEQKSHKEQQYQQHPTFIYHAAPSAPYDHISQTRGALYYIGGVVKLICRTLLFIGFLHVLSQIILNFHHDMENKVASYESDLLGDQIYCQQQYESNRCSPNTRLPAVKELCRNWERCMMRPISVSKTKVLGETFAELFNGFVNELTVRTMIYTAIFGLGTVWSITTLFSNFKKSDHFYTPQPISSSIHSHKENDNIPNNSTIKRLELQPYL